MQKSGQLYVRTACVCVTTRERGPSVRRARASLPSSGCAARPARASCVRVHPCPTAGLLRFIRDFRSTEASGQRSHYNYSVYYVQVILAIV